MAVPCDSRKRPGFRLVADIQQRTTPTDGETKPTWSTFLENVPCSREYKTPRETISGDRVQDVPRYKIMMRFTPNVEPTMRIVFPTTTSGTNDTYEIVGVGDPEGNRRWLVADCVLLGTT